LADGMMGQMMEPVVLPEEKQPYKTEAEITKYKPWALTGTKNKDHRNRIVSYWAKPEELEHHIIHLFEKYAKAEKELVRYETIGAEDPEIVFVAFGTMARIVAEVIEILNNEGIKAGMIRPISLWPFPKAPFEALSPEKTKVVISTELSMGQLLADVENSVQGRIPTRLINRVGGIVPTTNEILERAKKILGELK
jgi:2-oxoglutarate ferredoxin oxidoreductase subunit alpha